MERIITLYCARKEVQYLRVPMANVGEMIRAAAAQVKDKPFAVDVHVGDKLLMPTDENRCFFPETEQHVVLVQNCSGDTFCIPNKAWLFQ